MFLPLFPLLPFTYTFHTPGGGVPRGGALNMASKYTQVDVWRCMKCHLTYRTPSVPHTPECPKCGVAGWWQRFEKLPDCYEEKDSKPRAPPTGRPMIPTLVLDRPVLLDVRLGQTRVLLRVSYVPGERLDTWIAQQDTVDTIAFAARMTVELKTPVPRISLQLPAGPPPTD